VGGAGEGVEGGDRVAGGEIEEQGEGEAISRETTERYQMSKLQRTFLRCRARKDDHKGIGRTRKGFQGVVGPIRWRISRVLWLVHLEGSVGICRKKFEIIERSALMHWKQNTCPFGYLLTPCTQHL